MWYSNLFVAKLPRHLCDGDLLQIFSNFNPLGAKIMLDPSTGNSKGFGFVLFDKEEEGRTAYERLNRKLVRVCNSSFNLLIYPSQHNGKAVTLPSRAVYIRNIPTTMGEREVQNFLSNLAPLEYCAMRGDHHGNPVWVVYAEFDTPQNAQRVLDKLHGNSNHFGGPPIMVKYADTDEAKRERRRRREEGRLAPGPALKGACLFPPPRPGVVSLNQTQVSQSATETSPSCSPAAHHVTKTKIVAPMVEVEPRAQPLYFSTSPVAAMPPLLPVDVSYDGAAATVPLQTADCPAANGVLVLGNGQQVFLTPNAVNLHPTKFNAPPTALLVPAVDTTLVPLPPQRTLVYGPW
ncbi:RNA-binding protein, putative [Trypanosoma brucei gambiense DAL972]|uniref:RNA-binding protein, putative n=1 Tax=Trypanosoma brucei gambiense (strain MHOM/CI/86/DAL972) TaxID=679716 RepID=C9ZR15_TRYB9|nr:RNA-binding protein, putative [Trypanosoma brucei gambiense DAL972]CBH11845.1 RNA-binding protein, putative [Trypanosoma brucei gambiense DAL972]|eukprot:XP_011774130.1 RNA-binding protein, putative [Trypanosoma brucei gambiense DAL972]